MRARGKKKAKIFGYTNIQWNPSIMATIGTKDFGHYRGVTTNQGVYKYFFNAVGTKVSGHYREGGH